MKIPLVASGVEGLAELVKHEQNALIPSHNTPQEIAECIRRLVDDTNLREKLIDNAYRFTEGFGVSQCVNAVWDAYMDLDTDLQPS
jgi:glycosyltransferase involved in cell wall biosynthesis